MTSLFGFSKHDFFGNLFVGKIKKSSSLNSQKDFQRRVKRVYLKKLPNSPLSAFGNQLTIHPKFVIFASNQWKSDLIYSIPVCCNFYTRLTFQSWDKLHAFEMLVVKLFILFFKIFTVVEGSYKILNIKCSASDSEMVEFNVCNADQINMNINATIKKPMTKMFVS